MATADSASPHPAPAWAAALVGGCFALLCAAWAGANPPGASPDEPSHLVKAYASGTGQLEGRPYPADIVLDDPRSTEWFRATGRSYLVPAEVAPPESAQCYAFDPDATPACQRLDPPATRAGDEVLTPTHLGTYNPALYVPAGLAARTADSFSSATSRARWVNAAMSAGLLAAAALLVRRRGALALAGFALAATPMVVFLSASVNTNGIEAAAAVCVWAGATRIIRQPGEVSVGPWVAVGVAGSVLALSRPLGAVILAAIVVVSRLLAGPEWRRLLRRSRRLVLAGGAAAAAFVFSAAWAVLVMPSPDLDIGLAARTLDDAVLGLPNQARQLVGIFGWNDTTMPLVAYVLALGAVAALGVAALRVGDRRDRLALAGLAAAVVIADVAIAVLIEAQIGFGMQARYVLPLAVGFPLLAAEIVGTRTGGDGGSVPPWRAVHALFAAAGVLQGVAFLTNAHRYAVGRSASWAPPWESRWSPDGGLLPWLALVVVAVIGLVAVGPLMRLGAGVRRRPGRLPALTGG
ncbi:MAG: DUF2142 domain-containing protein [Acidimicrobiales bacterium]